MKVTPSDGSAAPEPRRSEAKGGSLAAAADKAWRIAILLGTALLAAYMLSYLRALLVPLVVALLMAAVVRPAVGYLMGRGWPRGLAVLAPMLVLSLVLVGSLAAVGLSIRSESSVLELSFDRMTDVTGGLLDRAEEQFGVDAVSQLRQWTEGNTERVSSFVGSMALGVLSGLSGLGLATVLCFFLLLDLPKIKRGLASRMSPGRYRRVESIAASAWERLEAYLGGLTLTAAANSLMFGLGLWVLGVPMVLANMAITFIGSYIPYVGPVTATVVAGSLALGAGGWQLALMVAGLGVLVQFIEGNVLHPVVVGGSVSISPFFTVVVVVGFGAVLGLIGALIAVPASVTALLLFDAFRKQPAAYTADGKPLHA